MDSLEKLNRSREEDKAALLEEVARQQAILQTLRDQALAMASELETKKTGLDERLAAAGKRLEYLESQRKVAGKLVPAPILGRYEFIRSRLHNPVIVPVSAGICGGCHISIPPQAFIELQKGQQILSCPNCQRLIYWCEHFSAETTEACATDQTAA
jgi:predicted  nucleic acid-binding Zn-ribbon protein